MKQINTVRDILETGTQTYSKRTAFAFRDFCGTDCSVSYGDFKRDTDALQLLFTKRWGSEADT